MHVLKFGGTSVGSTQAIERAADITAREILHSGVVVVSALSDTTDSLLEASKRASKGDPDLANAIVEHIKTEHWALAQALNLAQELHPAWDEIFTSLSGLIEGMSLLGEASPKARDGVLAIGESLSAHLFAALLRSKGLDASFRDARTVMATNGRHGKAKPDLENIHKKAQAWKENLASGGILVTQGFIGAAPNGSTTTLGRGGSDTSATLLGEALEATEVQIWTDVDGILSADPSLVKDARHIPVMSLREAAALSAFGAKVIHADALAPVRRAGFRLVVANTLRPEASRTEIRNDFIQREKGEITSVAYKEGLVCLRFQPELEMEVLFSTVTSLLEAGATSYGLLATPDGSLLMIKPETAAAEHRLEHLEGAILERGWAVVALVGEGLKNESSQILKRLAELRDEPIQAILAGDCGISIPFLARESSLPQLIPNLHALCAGGVPC